MPHPIGYAHFLMKYILLLACLAVLCGCASSTVREDARATGAFVREHGRLITTNPDNDPLGPVNR